MQNFPLNLLSFPLWWYMVGAPLFFDWYKRKIHYSLQSTGLSLFSRHMLEPLYKDYTKSGIVLSFFIRIFILIYKVIRFALSVLFYGLVFLLFLLALPAVLTMIIFQIFHYV